MGTLEIGGRNRTFRCHWQISRQKWINLKINNNNKTNTKHEFNVKYERYKQDISKDRKLCLGKKNVISDPLLYLHPPSSKATKE